MSSQVSVTLKRLYGERSFIACYPDLAYMESGNIFEIDCFLVCEARIGDKRTVIPLFVELVSKKDEPYLKFCKQLQVRSTSPILWLHDEEPPPESMLACPRLKKDGGQGLPVDPLVSGIKHSDKSRLGYSDIVSVFSQVASLAGDVYVHLNFYLPLYTSPRSVFGSSNVSGSATLTDLFEDISAKLRVDRVAFLNELDFIGGEILGVDNLIRDIASCSGEIFSLKLSSLNALIHDDPNLVRIVDEDRLIDEIKDKQFTLADRLAKPRGPRKATVGLLFPQSIEGEGRIANFVVVVKEICDLVGIGLRYVFWDRIAEDVVRRFERNGGFRVLGSEEGRPKPEDLVNLLNAELSSEGLKPEDVELYLIVRDYDKDYLIEAIDAFCGRGANYKRIYILYVPEMFVCIERNKEVLELRNKLKRFNMAQGVFDKLQILRLR